MREKVGTKFLRPTQNLLQPPIVQTCSVSFRSVVNLKRNHPENATRTHTTTAQSVRSWEEEDVCIDTGEGEKQGDGGGG